MNTTIHISEQLKWRLLMLRITLILTLVKKVMLKILSFKIGDHVRISNYKHIFGIGYTLNRADEEFVIQKVKSTVPLILLKSLLEHSIKEYCRI